MQTSPSSNDRLPPSFVLAQPDRVIAACASGFEAWSMLGVRDRLARLQAIKEPLRNAASELTHIAARELGSSEQWVRLNLLYSERQIDQLEQLVEQLEASASNAQPVEKSRVVRQAVGVVLGIAPWNAPITLAFRAILPALMCGNTVVLVSSAHCPELHRRVIQVCRDAGLPEDVLGLVEAQTDDPDFFATLISHPAIRRINFTGSSRVGRLIALEAARNLKRAVLELSGKAAMIVLPDTDEQHVIDAACFGAFFNQGQICMSTENLILVNHPNPGDFDQRLVAHMTQVTKLRRESLGSVITTEAVSRLLSLIEDAVNCGAKVLVGGRHQGTFIEPTILSDVTSEMRIYHEEIFGPILCITHVTDVDQAVFRANDTEYGLAASIYTEDLQQAHKIAARLETGIVQINGPTLHDDPQFPFGGVKSSGYGRFGGTAVIDEFTELRWIGVHSTGTSPSL